MAEEFSGDVDLFGDPYLLPNGKRGRPAHMWTVRNSNKIKLLLALGWSNERIAGALYITQPTLRKHYFSELKARMIMRDRLDARRFEQMMDAANDGNVSAMKALEKMIEKSDLMLMARTFDPIAAQKSEELKARAIGKKEQQLLDAQSAGEGSSWSSDLTPGFQVN